MYNILKKMDLSIKIYLAKGHWFVLTFPFPREQWRANGWCKKILVNTMSYILIIKIRFFKKRGGEEGKGNYFMGKTA
jgi:hypothetical protein